MHQLSVTGLTKTFGSKTILNDISLECSTGEIMGIFGRNGSGKSTLLKILFGTLKANAISLSINDTDLSVKEVIPQSKIAYLPQDSFLPKGMKVRDVIPLYFEDGDKQDKLFYRREIHRMANRAVGTLSMGEVRYFELLLVSHLNHPFLMLDEPFSMVEPLYKEKIKELLLELKVKKGIILTDHYYADVLSISNKNLLLKDGKLITVESENELAAHGYITAANF